MPIIAVVHLLIAITLGVHAVKTGRANYWLFILLMMPLVGSIAYIAIELLPEWAQTRRARKIASDIGTLVAPDREFRRRQEHAGLVDSVDAKLQLADECERKGMWEDALALYKAAATGVYVDDEKVLTGLARVGLELGQLDAVEVALERFQAAHPKARNATAHLLFARLQEAQGKLDEAAGEYAAVSRYFVGLEVRTRQGLLLLRRGEPQKAKALFEEVVRAAKARSIVLTDEDHAWLKVAKANC